MLDSFEKEGEHGSKTKLITVAMSTMSTRLGALPNSGTAGIDILQVGAS